MKDAGCTKVRVRIMLANSDALNQFVDKGIERIGMRTDVRTVKRPGMGWSTCCPPTGNKKDIVHAIEARRAARGVEIGVRGNVEIVSEADGIQDPGDHPRKSPDCRGLQGTAGVDSGLRRLVLLRWCRLRLHHTRILRACSARILRPLPSPEGGL